MANRSNGIGGLIFLCLFLSIFLISGVAVLIIGVRKLANGQSLGEEEVIAALTVGSLFTIVSLGAYAGIFYGSRKLREENALKERFPSEPWKWNTDWDAGRIASSSRAGLIALWLFAIAFSIVSAPLIYKGLQIYEDEGVMVLVIAGLFGLVGLGMLIAAVRKTIAWFTYGQSYCILATNPGVIGGWFKADIHSGLLLGPNDQLKVTLRCVRRYTTGSGKNRSTHTDYKWEEETLVPADKTRRTQDGRTEIPVAFAIPRDCEATTMDDNDDRILWQLEVEASVPGVDYAAEFEVPVFVTPDSSDSFDPQTEAYALSEEQVQNFARTSKIRVRSIGARGMEIYAPPARAAGAAIMTTLFFTVWTGAIVFMIKLGAPVFFVVVFCLFDVLLICIVLSMWLGSSRTTVNGDSLTITTKVAGIGMTRHIHKNEVESVSVDIGMRSGEKAYYQVNLRLPGGKKRTVASAIRDKNEARWVASVIETQLEAG